MPKINPTQSWLPLETRYRAESNPVVATLVKAVRDHMEHEIAGNLAPLMATLTEEPVYHFWGSAPPMVLRGRAAVEGFYQQLIASGGNQFEVVVDRIIADVHNVVTEGQVKQVRTGKELRASGTTEILGKTVADGELFLTTAQLVTVWPGDGKGKLVGEDIYFGHDTLARIEQITPADLPAGYRWQHRV